VNPELTGLNTEVCEQKFYKFLFQKHSVRHMNKQRYSFFFLQLCDLHNEHEMLK
jgi:hypothetical protein